MGWHILPPWKVPLGSVLPSNKPYMVPLTHVSQAPNGISIVSAIFTQLIRVPNIHRHTDHAICDICSNRPHQCTACRLCSLNCKKNISKENLFWVLIITANVWFKQPHVIWQSCSRNNFSLVTLIHIVYFHITTTEIKTVPHNLQ